MAGLGLVAGALLGGIIAGSFSRQSTTFSATDTQVVEAISEQMQRALQTTSQTAVITQQINAQDAVIRCQGTITIANTTINNAVALGTFDVKSSAQVSNAIANQMVYDIANSSTVRTSFGSSLPSNTTVTQMTRNITQIVRQVYTSENLNSMLQTIQVNQVLNLQGATINGGADCNFTNLSSSNLLARNSLQVLSESLFTNSITSSFMTQLRNTYNGQAQGLFGPISDFFSMIQWVAIAIVVVIGIVVVVGAVLRLLAANKGIKPQSVGLNTNQLLAIDSLKRQITS